MVLFAVSIDTEADKSPTWEVPGEPAFRSVTEGIPDLLTPIFEAHGARPTYLVSSEVLEDRPASEALARVREGELGTHLHGDAVLPERRVESLAGERAKDMQCSYPPEVEMMKLRTLTEQFASRFGRRPLSFRAGRFGAGGNTITCLERLGYLVDSSVTPHLRWSYPEGSVDFSHAPDQPYFPDGGDIASPGRSGVLEVPVTITSSPLGRALGNLAPVRSSGLLRGIVNRTLPTVWLRPSHTSSARMIEVMERTLRARSDREVVVLNMMFHSMEVVAGASPVTRSEEEVAGLLRRTDEALDHARRRGVRFVTLAEVYPYYRRDATSHSP